MRPPCNADLQHSKLASSFESAKKIKLIRSLSLKYSKNHREYVTRFSKSGGKGMLKFYMGILSNLSSQ